MTVYVDLNVNRSCSWALNSGRAVTGWRNAYLICIFASSISQEAALHQKNDNRLYGFVSFAVLFIVVCFDYDHYVQILS